MNLIKAVWVLVLIVALAAALRLWQVSSNPPGLTWDEAALGYNAYSILATGKDEYGELLPLNLKSFGDFKPAVYTYLTIPFMAVFGLNEIAVRLPAVFFGIGMVVLVYLLVMELFKQKVFALLSALVIAISPLAIQFTRPAFETGIALFLNTLAVLLFVKGLRNSRLLVFSAIFFGISLFTYQSSRLFIPLLIIGLLFIYKDELKVGKWLMASAGVMVAFAALLIFLVVGLGQSARLAAMNFFAYTRSEEQVNLISSEDNLDQNGLGFQFLHGEWFAYTRGLFERYLIYFSPKMLFVEGDYSPRHRVPDLGVLPYASLLLIPFGIVFLLRSEEPGAKVILFWLTISPLPAVLSRDLITMIRAFNILLPLTVLEGAGLFWLMECVRQKNRKLFYFSLAVAAVLIAGNLAIFLDRYFVHTPKEYSSYWLYGYKQVISDLSALSLQKKYDKIVFTDTYGQPYIYYLFYTKYPPRDFQMQAVLDQPTVDVGTVRKIDNIEFRHVYWPTDRSLKNSLFIGTFEELPDKDILPFEEYRVLKEIKFLDNQPAFRIVETR